MIFGGPLRIEYEITPEDWSAFGEYHVRTAPQMRRFVHNGVALGVMFVLAVTGLLSATTHSISFLVFGVVFAVFWVWYWPHRVVVSVRAHMAAKNRPCMRGLHVIEALPDGLHTKCDLSESRIGWAGIRRVIRTTDHAFVMLDDVQGYVIPKRRVITGDFEPLIDEIESRRAGAGV